MRILSARIFLSFLAGKYIFLNRVHILRPLFLKKKWRMRILSARIFSKFFGGKFKIFTIGYLDEQ